MNFRLTILPPSLIQLIDLLLKPAGGIVVQPCDAETDGGEEDRFGHNDESRML
jgi:hypothetical protein